MCSIVCMVDHAMKINQSRNKRENGDENSNRKAIEPTLTVQCVYNCMATPEQGLSTAGFLWEQLVMWENVENSNVRAAG